MRPQKITFGEMRSGGGPTGIPVYCADYRCSHSIEMSAEQWPDDLRLWCAHAFVMHLDNLKALRNFLNDAIKDDAAAMTTPVTGGSGKLN
jgi:hypothetical protein